MQDFFHQQYHQTLSKKYAQVQRFVFPATVTSVLWDIHIKKYQLQEIHVVHYTCTYIFILIELHMYICIYIYTYINLGLLLALQFWAKLCFSASDMPDMLASSNNLQRFNVQGSCPEEFWTFDHDLGRSSFEKLQENFMGNKKVANNTPLRKKKGLIKGLLKDHGANENIHFIRPYFLKGLGIGGWWTP